MSLAVLVLGATGAVGRGVVQASVEASRPVVAVARDAAALAELRGRHPCGVVETLVGSVADDASARHVVTALQGMDRPFAGVVSALGCGLGRGRLLDGSSTGLRQYMDDTLLPHWVAARHLLPWLAATGRVSSYVLVGGPGGRHPWAGYGPRSISAAAVRMLAQVLHEEARALSVRLQLLEVDSPARTESNRSHACPRWPTAEAIGRKALALLDRRNDARCTQPVIDFSEACEEPGTAPQEGSRRHTHGASHVRPASTASGRIEAQEMDSRPSLLPARCLEDARRLLTALIPPNQEQNQ